MGKTDSGAEEANAAAGGAAGAVEKLGGPADERVGELVTAGNSAWATAGPAERLAALDAAAGEYLERERPAHTRRAYAADWRAWEDYTGELGIPLYAATIGSLVGFVRWLEVARGYAPATVERRLAGAVVGLKQARVLVPEHASKAAWEAITRYEERVRDDKEGVLPHGRGAAPALLADDIEAIGKACPDTAAGLRDRALVVIGWTIGARDADLSRLACHEIVPFGTGYQVLLPRTKTGRNDEHPVLPRRTDRPALDGAGAWEAWRDAAGLTAGPALRPVDRWDHPHPSRGLSTNAVCGIVKAAGRRAGLTVTFTGHSMRHGMATEARRGGADRVAIERQGRWAPGSRQVDAYIEQVDRERDNAALYLGRGGES
ncbi:tyrosine-type recombinase/integrase [Saccharopolyspora taberi]|uniref:Site-specific integrase n=1 Tax=Saccharopolyspora taberi TaxID=60895 RepID=A0ABN3V853_9PSEU